MVFNATFSNISAISWRPVLVVKEAEYKKKRYWAIRIFPFWIVKRLIIA
jgi:hypothetical protein